MLNSPLARVEHQAIDCELHVNVGESGLPRRLLLLLFGHVERDTSRRVIERSVVANVEESGDSENLVDLVDSLHGDDKIKPTSDAVRPVLGGEAGEHKGGGWMAGRRRRSNRLLAAQT